MVVVVVVHWWRWGWCVAPGSSHSNCESHPRALPDKQGPTFPEVSRVWLSQSEHLPETLHSCAGLLVLRGAGATFVWCFVHSCGGSGGASASASLGLSEASRRRSLENAESMTSPTVNPFGLGFAMARFHGVGFCANRWDGMKPSPSRHKVYFGAGCGLLVPVGLGSLTRALSLPLGHRAEV